MFSAASNYASSLATRFGQVWNRFWFTPSDCLTASVLRILAGLAATYYIASFSGELVRWFGEGGLFPMEALENIAGGRDGMPSFRISYFRLAHSPTELWVLHGLGLAIAVAYTLGLFSRITNVLTLVVVLSYIHRAPIIAGPFETVLCFLLLYLCFAPTGVYLSLDRRFGFNKAADRVDPRTGRSPDVVRSWTATLAIRLIQLHLAALSFMTALWMLAGPAWWNGEATWLLMAQTRTRLIDWSFIRGAGYLLNFLTHAIVFYQLAFALLIWNRTARPLMLALSVIAWLVIGLISAQVPYALLMMLAGLAFVSSETLRVERNSFRSSST